MTHFVNASITKVDVFNLHERPVMVIVKCDNIAEAIHIYYKISGDRNFSDPVMRRTKPEVDSGKYRADLMSGIEFLLWDYE